MRDAPEAAKLPEMGTPGTGKSGAERRATPRIPCRMGVRFRSSTALADAVRATTRNIGAGGLCLRTRHPYERGAALEIVIELGDGESLALTAVVAWSRPGQAIGVRFDALSDAQREVLSRLLQRAAVEADDALEAAADSASLVRD